MLASVATHSDDLATFITSLNAVEMTRAALRLDDRSDPINKIVAEKIIKLAQEGERDPNELCERTLSFFGPQPK